MNSGTFLHNGTQNLFSLTWLWCREINIDGICTILKVINISKTNVGSTEKRQVVKWTRNLKFDSLLSEVCIRLLVLWHFSGSLWPNHIKKILIEMKHWTEKFKYLTCLPMCVLPSLISIYVQRSFSIYLKMLRYLAL